MATADETIMFQGTGLGILSHEADVAVTFTATTKKIARASGDFTTGPTPVLPGMYMTWETAADLANSKLCGKVVAVTALEITVDSPIADAASATVKLRFFKPLGLVTGYTGPGSSNPRVDVSHSESTSREFKAGLQDNGSWSFEGNTARNDAGLIAFKTLRNSRLNTDFLIADSDRLGFERFNGGVESFERSGQLDGAVAFSGAVFVSGSTVDSELFV